MTDLEITKACAEAMGLPVASADASQKPNVIVGTTNGRLISYDPLHDDAQAMALVKKFKPHICFDSPVWDVRLPDGDEAVCDADLNRAICETVAKMHLSTRTPA